MKSNSRRRGQLTGLPALTATERQATIDINIRIELIYAVVEATKLLMATPPEIILRVLFDLLLPEMVNHVKNYRIKIKIKIYLF